MVCDKSQPAKALTSQRTPKSLTLSANRENLATAKAILEVSVSASGDDALLFGVR